MSVLAVIPARGGSKGIPNKNVIPVGKHPLIYYTINAALDSNVCDRVVVSTDSAEIGHVAREYGAQVVPRPAELARDESTTESCLEHVVEHLAREEKYVPDTVMLLQATSPLRTADDIKDAFREFRQSEVDSLLSVMINKFFIWEKTGDRAVHPINYDPVNRPRRQDINVQFVENGAIYIFKRTVLEEYRSRLGGRIGYYVMPEDRSIEIDSQLDLKIAELLCEEMQT